MKKILAMILCLSLLITSISAFAAVEESYKSVLELVKTRLPSTGEFDDFTANQRVSEGVKIYQFYWRGTESKKYMEVECLENGIITRFSSSADELVQEKAMSDISKEDALKKAKSAFYKLNPDLKDKTVIENGHTNKQLWETRQNFVISRVENGIEVYRDNGHIEMDMNADKILWYYMNWNNYSDFPNPKDAISVEDAQKLFAEKLGLHLIYKAKIEDGEIKPYLVYTIKEDPYKYIDMNGDVIKCNPYSMYAGAGGTANDKLMMNGTTEQFSKAEIAEMEKLDGLLSQEDATKIAENENLFNLEGFKIESINLSRDYYDKEKYTYSFTFYSEKDKLRVRVSLDAKSGEILSFSKPDYNEKEITVSEEIAEQTLKDAVKKLCKTNFDEYELVQYEILKNEEYSVTYNRIVNGIKFPQDSITVSVNKYTGKLSYYSKTYSKAEFPSKENVISLNMIYKNAFDLFSYGLKYVPTYEKENENAQIKLVFAFDSETFDIDPFTGEKYQYNNDAEVLVYEDIKDHYAQKYIEELASYGVGLGNKNFMPDEKIKQKELISLLVRVFYKYYSTYPISDKETDEDYEIAVREGIITKDEINKDAYVLRKDASKFLVNALGYKDIAKIDSIFNCPFSDVTENKGSISILYGLGIVSGNENGNFKPDEYFLRGDTMIMLYKSLSK